MKKVNKVMVIGCPGGGKSTFSRALQGKTGLPLIHLDNLYWREDKTIVEKSIFLERLSLALQGEAWIIDGNYLSTMELRLAACDTVIFLDYPLDICLRGAQERIGKVRDDLPWVEQETDGAFLEWIKGYEANVRPQVMDLLARYPQKQIVIFTSRGQADDFLRNLPQKKEAGEEGRRI